MFTARSPMQKARKKSILLVHEDKNKHLFFSLRLAGFAIAAWVLLHNRHKTPKNSSFHNQAKINNFEWNRRGSSEARSESVKQVCEWALLIKSVSKLYLQVDLICQYRHLVSYRQVPGSIPGRGSIDYFSFFPHFSLFF